MNTRKILQTSKIIVLSLMIGLGTNYILAAWTPAPANPPSSNAAAPLNVSASYQTKAGGGITVAPGTVPGDGFQSSFLSATDGIFTDLRINYASTAFPFLIVRDLNTHFAMLGFQTGAVRDWYIGENTLVNSDFHLYNYSGAGGSEALTVTKSNGNVGINIPATNPATPIAEKLQVIGKVRADDFCLNSDSTKCLAATITTVNGGGGGSGLVGPPDTPTSAGNHQFKYAAATSDGYSTSLSPGPNYYWMKSAQFSIPADGTYMVRGQGSYTCTVGTGNTSLFIGSNTNGQYTPGGNGGHITSGAISITGTGNAIPVYMMFPLYLKAAGVTNFFFESSQNDFDYANIVGGAAAKCSITGVIWDVEKL